MAQGRGSPGESRDTSAADSRKLETATRKRRTGSRGRGTARKIQRAALQRQAAWLETGHPNVTERLTRERDVLYGEHRDEQAGTLTDPFYGRTWESR